MNPNQDFLLSFFILLWSCGDDNESTWLLFGNLFSIICCSWHDIEISSIISCLSSPSPRHLFLSFIASTMSTDSKRAWSEAVVLSEGAFSNVSGSSSIFSGMDGIELPDIWEPAEREWYKIHISWLFCKCLLFQYITWYFIPSKKRIYKFISTCKRNLYFKSTILHQKHKLLL